MRGWRVGIPVLLGIVLFTGPGWAQGGQGVEIKARVSGQIVLEIVSGSAINFVVDPLLKPEDTAVTELLVRTNVAKYSVLIEVAAFVIEGAGYDLIKHERFFVRAKTPGKGKPLDSWTAPKGQLTLVRDEDGYTGGEIIVVEYLIKIDFSVPAGEAKTKIIFTAVPSF